MMAEEQHVCEVCGVSDPRRRVCYRKKYGLYLCNKHALQLRKCGCIVDTSPYSVYDLNRYRVDGDVVIMDITDNHERLLCETKYDLCFLDQVSKRKWRRTEKNHAYYIATKAMEDEQTAHTTLHRYIATLAGWDIDGYEIDHINGDPMDNRLGNLRLATRVDQCGNLAPQRINKLGIRGVCYSKRDHQYKVDFIYNKQRHYFRHFDTLEEAVYVRFLLEAYYYGDVVTNRHMNYMKPYIDKLSDSQKQSLGEYVDSKISPERSCDFAQVC